MSRHIVSCIGLVAVLSAFPAWAADDKSESEWKAVITAQIDAIGRGDAATAHNFAAPGIKQKFPDAVQFLDMVQRSYAPLVHPKSTHFEPANEAGLGPTEKVTIVDSNGVVWTAIYTFQEVEGQWRITGCALLKAPDTSA